MSEQWLGLHNQDDHEWGWGERDAWCTTCEGPRRDRGQCLAKKPCRCCLAAEVEVLRNSLGHCAAENATLRENDVLWRSRMKTAEAQVQRVRGMCDGIEPDHSVFVGDVLDALNGGRR